MDFSTPKCALITALESDMNAPQRTLKKQEPWRNAAKVTSLKIQIARQFVATCVSMESVRHPRPVHVIPGTNHSILPFVNQAVRTLAFSGCVLIPTNAPVSQDMKCETDPITYVIQCVKVVVQMESVQRQINAVVMRDLDWMMKPKNVCRFAMKSV